LYEFFSLPDDAREVQSMYDITIRNGTIINGTGESISADVAVKNGYIVKIGRIEENCMETIDACGKIVAPGFIDFHSHNDRAAMQKTPLLAKITQGVTTEVIGNCGFCAADSGGGIKDKGIEIEIHTVLGACPKGVAPLPWAENLDYLRKTPLVTNLVPLAGHNNIRTSVMGIENRPANAEELAKMLSIMEDAMKAGYWGLSTGLIYPPGIFTPASEIMRLACSVSRLGGIYTTHIRGEAETLLDAIKEAVSVGRETGVSTEISHLKAMGMKNWDKTDRAIQLIYGARDQGVDVNYDQYPYTAGSTTATVLLPPWMLEGGQKGILRRLGDTGERERARRDILNGIEGWQNLLSDGPEKVVISRVSTPGNRRFEGKNLLEISSEYGKDYIETLFDIMEDEQCNILMIVFSMSEESVRKILKEKIGFVGTDGIPCRRPHPRLWGSFPRVLARYVREEKILSLDDAIYKFARGPAAKLNLAKRGQVKEGNIADIVVFDREKVADMATYKEPEKPSTGIDYVIINGKTAIAKGSFKNVMAGRLLKKGED